MLLELAAQEEMLPDDLVVLFRGHHLFESRPPLIRSRRWRNVSSYPDLRDLVLASDALVTDYSSLVFDYALTGRPVVFYVPDIQHYQQLRGLYLDLDDLALGPVVRTAHELGDVLRSLSESTVEVGEGSRHFDERTVRTTTGRRPHVSGPRWNERSESGVSQRVVHAGVLSGSGSSMILVAFLLFKSTFQRSASSSGPCL